MPEKHRGRPTTDNPKTMRVDVRLTEEELEMLDKYCQQAGVSRPQGLRDGIKALNAENEKEVVPLANVFTPLPHATRSKAGRTNIIALFGSVLQAACGRKRKDSKINGKDFGSTFDRAASCRQRNGTAHSRTSGTM